MRADIVDTVTCMPACLRAAAAGCVFVICCIMTKAAHLQCSSYCVHVLYSTIRQSNVSLLQAAREIAHTIASSSNRVFLSNESLLLNLRELEVQVQNQKK